MTVYEKLVQARLKFQSANVKKSGYNKGINKHYFELEDILPVCNKVCEEVKAVCVVSFTDTVATLEFIDCEKPEDRIVFTSPMSKANLKGCHEVQNLGAVESYLKRYLYQNCLEVSESDILDAMIDPREQTQSTSHDQPRKPAQPSKPKWTQAQITEMGNIMNSIAPNGSSLFTDEEKAGYRRIMLEGGNFELTITRAKNELAEKLQLAQADFPEDLF